MKEYQPILSSPHIEMASVYYEFGKERDYGKAQIFLEKYWLDNVTFLKNWLPVQNRIFQTPITTLPEMLFKGDFKLLVTGGGCLFGKSDFEKMRDCMCSMGEENFVIIQNDFGGSYKGPIFRLKFPCTITWEEMMSGDFVSQILCGYSNYEYMVYSGNGQWGKYAANEYKTPFNIIVFKSKYNQLFYENFKLMLEDNSTIENYLSEEYKERILSKYLKL